MNLTDLDGIHVGTIFYLYQRKRKACIQTKLIKLAKVTAQPRRTPLMFTWTLLDAHFHLRGQTVKGKHEA